MAVITISREIGSEGNYIGKKYISKFSDACANYRRQTRISKLYNRILNNRNSVISLLDDAAILLFAFL